MPIDVERLLVAELPQVPHQWTESDVILYNLGVGAGDPPTDPKELRYTYEGDLHAVPTYGTIPPFGMMMSLGSVEGLDVDLTRILHGEHELIVHRDIPNTGSVTQSGRVTHVYDKGRGALAVFEVVSVLEGTEEPLFTNRAGIFVRGEGGFGGDPGPPTANQPPEREPDHIVRSATLRQQALLYRMASGDKNPLHADPAFASLAGYERPILHGLCTYGVVAKAVIDAAFDGEPSRLHTYKARFTGHVFPGETLVTKVWDEADALIVTAETEDRGTKVLANAAITTR